MKNSLHKTCFWSYKGCKRIPMQSSKKPLSSSIGWTENFDQLTFQKFDTWTQTSFLFALFLFFSPIPILFSKTANGDPDLVVYVCCYCHTLSKWINHSRENFARAVFETGSRNGKELYTRSKKTVNFFFFHLRTCSCLTSFVVGGK